MRYCYTILLMTILLKGFSQPVHPIDYGLKNFTIQDKKLGKISFHVDTIHLDKKAPFFIDVNGSGGMPLCLYMESKGYSSVMNTFNPAVMNRTKEKYHYVILDKPGTNFCDTIDIQGSIDSIDYRAIFENYKVSDEYAKRLSLNWRVEATMKVISYLIKHKFWDKTNIVAQGYSEGGQVVPLLAYKDKRITHVVPIVGSGLNQFYDMILDYRFKARNGEITHEAAQDSIRNAYEVFRDIYADPSNTTKSFSGHSYLRWSSFCGSPPIEALTKLSIPIYMIVGTSDTNSPIYGLDYVPLEFMRLGKTNLTYDPCIGCDHGLMSMDGPDPQFHLEEYLDKVLAWVERN